MNPYEELANAIILQAVKDYRLTDDERELQEIERFFRSGWFGVLSKVDPEFLIKELRKSNLSSVIGIGTKFKSRTTGELEGALGLSPSKLNRDGNHDIKVGFAEPRSDGSSNAKLANILEYGKHGQPAKPFLKPAKTASRQECIDAMTKALDEEVEKL